MLWLNLFEAVCRFLCFYPIVPVLGFGSSLILRWCRRASILFLRDGLRIVLGIGFWRFRLCLRKFRCFVVRVNLCCRGVCGVCSIFRSGIGVSCLQVLGSRLWRGFVCMFGGSIVLGFLLCVVFGLFGLGGGLRRRIFGSFGLVVVGCFGVWGFFFVRLFVVFVLFLGRVCL